MRAKTLLRLFARTPAWTAVRARDRVRALLLDLAWRARSNGANGALLRGRADEERKGDRWSRDARERARAQLCKAHALSCGAYEKESSIHLLFIIPPSLSSTSSCSLSFLPVVVHEHTGAAQRPVLCGVSSGLRPAHFSSHFAATISAPPQRIFTRFAREFGHSRRCRCRPRFRARAPDRSRRPAPAWASRARREHPRPGQVRGHTLEAAHEAVRVAHASGGLSPSPGKLADRSACHGAAVSALRSTTTPRRSQGGRWRMSLGPSAELRARGVHFDRW